MPWVGLQFEIMVFPDHTYLLFVPIDKYNHLTSILDYNWSIRIDLFSIDYLTATTNKSGSVVQIDLDTRLISNLNYNRNTWIEVFFAN